MEANSILLAFSGRIQNTLFINYHFPVKLTWQRLR